MRRLTNVAVVAALAVAVAATGASAAGSGADPVHRAATPVGPGCADFPTEGEGSLGGMADDRAATAAANNPELATFVQVVDEAGLTAALDGEGPFTIFAPNNAAFEQIPQNVLDSILADSDLLNSILTYHVVSGDSLAPADLVAAGSVTTSNGAVLEITQEGDTISINGGEATVVCGGIPVANGTIYIIDSVLQPPTDDLGTDGSSSSGPSSAPDVTAVATPGAGPQGPLCATFPTTGDGSLEAMAALPAASAAATNPELSTFTEAVAAAGLTETLDGEGPFTIFAPSNEAFAALPPADLDAIFADPEALAAILNYHVVQGESLAAADLAAAGTAVTVQGGELTFAVEADGTLSINGGAANIACSNVAVSNGTVQVIDQLLVPPAG